MRTSLHRAWRWLGPGVARRRCVGQSDLPFDSCLDRQATVRIQRRSRGQDSRTTAIHARHQCVAATPALASSPSEVDCTSATETTVPRFLAYCARGASRVTRLTPSQRPRGSRASGLTVTLSPNNLRPSYLDRRSTFEVPVPFRGSWYRCILCKEATFAEQTGDARQSMNSGYVPPILPSLNGDVTPVSQQGRPLAMILAGKVKYCPGMCIVGVIRT